MEQEEKKLKVSIFDVVIVAAVAVIALAAFWMFKPSGAEISLSSTTPMRYTVELNGMPEGMSELIQPGDKIKDGAKNYDIGKVVSVTKMPYTVQSTDETTNTVKNVPLGGYESLQIVIEANMNTSGTALTTESGFTVTVGTQLSVAGPCYAGTGYVMGVERGD